MYQAVLRRRSITHEMVLADTVQNALEQGLRMAGHPVPRDLYTLSDEDRECAAQVRLELHYILPPDMQQMQIQAWTFPEATAEFARRYVAWLETLAP
jgi:hypothetical protein